MHSVFYTLQGEGPDVGRPCFFIRLAGCCLRCFWCDTEFENGRFFTPDALCERLLNVTRRSLAVLSGGEPLLQNIVPLIDKLNSKNVSVSIETAGTVFVPGLERLFAPDRSIAGNLIVCSPKTPRLDERIVPLVGAWKYIVRSGELSMDDGLPVRSTQRQGIPQTIFRAPKNGTPIYIQPCDEGSTADKTANLITAINACELFGYRLSVQTHKMIGVP